MNVSDIRRKLCAGKYEFIRHAFRRVIERNISEEELRQLGRNAEIIEEYPTDKYSPSCLLLGYTENVRPLHVQVCYSTPDMLKIITLYEPDPMEWIDCRIRRQS